MKLTRHNLVNVAIAGTAAILFGAFVFFATKGDNKKNDLAVVASSTTSTTRRVTTTNSSVPPTTFSVGTTVTTPTTIRTTTPTTRRTTTATTRGTTATTTATSPSGPATERSDNTTSFTHGEDGSFAASSTDPPGGADPFRFVIKSAQGAGGVSGDSASVKFTVTLTNNTAKTIAFPGGLKITVTMKTPGGSELVFTMTANDVTDIKAGETITLTQERGVSGYGTFEASATCEVDYG